MRKDESFTLSVKHRGNFHLLGSRTSTLWGSTLRNLLNPRDANFRLLRQPTIRRMAARPTKIGGGQIQSEVDAHERSTRTDKRSRRPAI